MNQTVTTVAPDKDTPYTDMRGAQRFTLLIRAAKLVCASGEFVCIVRDVSETGVRLRLFHDLPSGPDDTRMALELGNGEVYFIQRVWERDSHAGFQFAAPIDAHAFIAEVSATARRKVRLNVHKPAIITAQAETYAATICDISQNGARIDTSQHLAMGERIKLQTENFPAVIAKVCWRADTQYGLALEQFFTLEEFALIAAQLQLGPQGVAHQFQAARAAQ